MKTKETLDLKMISLDKLNPKAKPKSIRPMRSMMAVRSLKPRTGVAYMAVKVQEEILRN